MSFSRRSIPTSGFRRQQGVALVVALVLLLIVTILGLASMRGTVLQERMSGNRSIGRWHSALEAALEARKCHTSNCRCNARAWIARCFGRSLPPCRQRVHER